MPAFACAPRVSRAVCAVVLVAGALWSFGPVKAQTASSPAVDVWLTTVDQANLLAPQAPLSFAPDAGSTALTIDLDRGTAYQAMEGFGASFTDSSAWLVYNKLATAPVDNRQALLMRLFDRTAGIGLSYLRQPIGASDFALSRYSYDEMPAGQTDPGVTHFSIDHDRAYILPVLKKALAVNPDLRIVATPWSAPGWMKSSGSLIDGVLNAGAEADYAAYLVKFLQAYAAENVPIERLTVQNEPHYTPIDYPGMWMGADQQAEFIGNHLGPAMAAAGLRTRIDTWDHNWDDVAYAPRVLGDPIASSYVSGTAWHCYAGSPGAMTTVHDQYPAKDVLLTECSGGYWQEPFADGFAWDLENLIIGGTRNWARAITKWNIALDAQHGPHTGGCTTCTGLVTIDDTSGTVASFNYDYYSLGHISKFVRRGARRIASNTFGASSIEDVAFSNPDGSTVLIVFNADASASHTFKVREAGRSFSYSLPPHAAATFTWNGDQGTPVPTTNLALNRPVAASSTENASLTAVNAVDGNTGTRWSSAYSDPQWLQVDLGARYTLSSVVLAWEAAFAVAYQLQVSDDGTSWTTVYATGAGRGGTETIQPSATATGRYVRVYCTQRTYVYGQQWGYSLWELQVFGVPASAPPPSTNLALNRPAVASSTENASLTAGNAVDGNAGTRWGSAFATQSATDREWLLVDLGVVSNLFALQITWEAAYAERYEVQVSSDGASFSTVLSASSVGGTDRLTLPSGVYGRYVRLLMTQKHAVWGSYWGYSIWELEVTGQALTAPPPPPSPPPTPPPTTLLDRPLRLATWNIQHGDRDDDVRDTENQMDLLASLNADVVVLAEMATWDGDYPTQYLQGLTQRTGVAWNGYYESSTGSACSGPEGNMILTRLPIVSQSARRLVANAATPCDILSTRVVLRVELSVNGRQLQVFGTHLDELAANRSTQFPQLANFVAGFTGEKLLGGDFNTKPDETGMWSLLGIPDAWTDVVYTGDTGYTHHSTANTPPGKRIDYWRRAGANLRVSEISVVQTLRSDHNPVVLDVVVQR